MRMTDEEIQISKDSELMTQVISLIASYAVENDMSPNETIKTVAKNMLGLLKIATFENWEKKTLPSVRPTHGTCKDCSHRDPEDKKCDCGHDIQWQLPREDNWYCADFEK